VNESGEETRKTATRAEQEAARRAHEVTRRAIRRLDILEWVIFAAGAGLATAGGALVAWMASGLWGWGFRSVWIGASLLLFVVPGGIAVAKIKREERAAARRLAELLEGEGNDG